MGTISRPASILVALIATLGAAWAQGDGGASRIEETRETIAKWVETQKIIAEERAEWQTSKAVLEQRIDLLSDQIRDLEERIAETREGLAEAREQSREIEEEKAALQKASAALVEMIGELETSTKALLEKAPEPLSSKVSLLAQSLPKDSASTDMSTSERFGTVIGLLNEFNKFALNVHQSNELRTLPDGTTAEVTALYLGLGQAYYVSSDGRVAGVGRPGEDGWDWEPMNEIAPQVTQALAVLNNESVPAYVPLPARVDR